MKPDERALLLAVRRGMASAPLVSPRDCVAALGIPWKRATYLLWKWCQKKRWYDYGVSLDLGWLTMAGLAAAEALTEEEPAHAPPR